jgi:multidrug efflux system membrane fusion protein
MLVGCAEKNPKAVETPPPVVEVAKPVLAPDVSDYQIFTARTEAVESVDVKTRVTGYLMKAAFKDGDDVVKGQDLFLIDDRQYKAALDKATADLEVAKAALTEKKAFYEIGLKVQKESKEAISEQELERRKGARDEATGAVKQAQAILENAQLNFNWCTVKAPIGGRINRAFVSDGNLVTQDVTILTNIVSLKPIWAYFSADQNTVLRCQQLIKEGKIKALRESELPVTMGFSADQGFPIQGAIDFVSNQQDPNTGSIRVRAVFPNKENLVAGLFTRIKVPVSAPHEAMLVSDRAIGTDQGQKFVMVANDENEVEYRPVDVGQIHAGLREVYRFRTITEFGPDGKESKKEVEVLKPTDRLIVNGLQRVRAGAKVDPKLIDMQTLLRGSSGDSKPEKQPASSIATN